MPNLSDFGNPTVYNPRTAQANADRETAAHQQALANNQAAAASQFAAAGNDKGAAAYQSSAQNLQGKADSYNPAPLQNAQNTYADHGIGSSYDTSTGQTSLASSSGLRESAIEFMRGKGLTDQQIRTNLNDPNFMGRIRSTMSNTGLGGTFDKNGMYVPSAAERLSSLPGERDAAIAADKAGGGSGFEVSQRYAKMEADLKAKAAQEAADNQAADQAKITGGVNGDQTVAPPSTASLGAQIATAGLPPDQKAIGDAYNQMIAASDQNAKDAKTNETADLAANKSLYDKQDATIKSLADAQVKAQADMKTLIENQKAQSDKMIADQEAAAQAQLQQQEEANIRAKSKEEVAAVNSAIAKIAMSGAGGSSGGLAEVAATTADFESQIQSIRTQFGIDSGTLTAKFTGLFQQAAQDYTTASVKAINDAIAQTTAITTQQLSTDKARADADQKVTDTFNAAIAAARTAHATTLKDAASAMNTLAENRAKAVALEAQNKEANRLKQEAIDAARTNRVDSQSTAAQNHADTLSTQDANGIRASLSEIQGKLSTTTAPYAVYQNVTAFKKQFDAAYNDFFGKNADGSAKIDPNTGKPVIPNAGQRATADGQMAFQFSHSQNPGSLRIQDVAAAMAEGNQSMMDKISATIDHAANGGGVLTDAIRTEMQKLIAQHYSDAQTAATSQLLTAWQDAQLANKNYPNAPQLLTPSNLTDDRVLQKAMYATQNNGLHDFMKGGGTTPTTGTPDTQSGSFSPSAKMKGGVEATIGTRTVTGTPEMVSALQKADSAMFQATGKHLDINSDYRSSAQQQQAYNDMLSGKIARAAPPGHSLHEKGLAADVTNWKEAEPYLVAAGLSPLGPVGSKIRSEDPAHFQLGGSNATGGSSYADSTSGNSDSLLQIAMADEPSDSSQ